MNMITATLRRIYMAPAEDGMGGMGAGGGADVESRIAAALFSGNEGDNADGDSALVDGQEEQLPVKDGKQPGTDGEDDGLSDDGNDDPDDGATDSNEDEQTLASVLGLDDDKLTYDEEGNVVFNAVIDGKVAPVKIQDLVKSYQLEGHVNNKSMKLESDRREFEQTRDTAYTELANRLESANAVIGMAEQLLLSDFQSIDWNNLRLSDPAEWAAQRQLFSERVSQLEAAKAQVGQHKTKMTAEQQQQEQAKQQQFQMQELQKMIADNPAWSDQNVMAKEVGEIGSFLLNQYGFKPEEVANAMDARLMRLIRDAHAYRSGKQSIEQKKVPDNVPKFRKPGSTNANRASLEKARKAKATKAAIRKSNGSIDSIAAALVDRM